MMKKQTDARGVSTSTILLSKFTACMSQLLIAHYIYI